MKTAPYKIDFTNGLGICDIVVQCVFAFLVDVDSVYFFRTNVYRNTIRHLNLSFKTATTEESNHFYKTRLQSRYTACTYPIIRYDIHSFREECRWFKTATISQHLLPYQTASEPTTVYTGGDTCKTVEPVAPNFVEKSFLLWDNTRIRQYIRKYAIYEQAQRIAQRVVRLAHLCHICKLDVQMVLTSFSTNHHRRPTYTPFVRRCRKKKYVYNIHTIAHKSNRRVSSPLNDMVYSHQKVVHELHSRTTCCEFPCCKHLCVRGHVPVNSPKRACPVLCHLHTPFMDVFRQLIRPTTNQLFALESAYHHKTR
jgi:hypothetical protein